jgi:hypothetical protein
VALRHAGFAEVLLRQDVDRDLAPLARHVDVARLEYERAVGVPDLRVPLGERDAFVRRLAFDREPTIDLHNFLLTGVPPPGDDARYCSTRTVMPRR